MFYVAERHTAIATDVRTIVRQCVLCGHQAHAKVLEQTIGVAEAPFFLFGKTAAAKAGDRALDALPRAMRHSADLAPCPKCKRRRPRAKWLAILDASVGPVIISIVLFFAFTFASMLVLAGMYAKPATQSPVGPMAIGIGVTAVVTGLWIWLGYRKRVRWVDTIAVEFDGQADRERRLVALPSVPASLPLARAVERTRD